MLPDLSAEERLAVASTWAYRAHAEEESRLRFQRLAGQLEEIHAEQVVTEMARRAAADEQRHALLCARVAAAYGGDPQVRPPPEAREVAPASHPLADRILYEIVAFCCIAETMNAALLTTTLERARAPEIRDAVHELLRDEVMHSRLGWAHLAAERAQGRGDFLGKFLPNMLEGTVSSELFQPCPEPAAAAARLEAHGNLTRSARRTIFETTLAQVVFPGFEAHSLDTRAARAWLQAREISG
jgi:hypothetical protein